jgi:hypothetical protein
MAGFLVQGDVRSQADIMLGLPITYTLAVFFCDTNFLIFLQASGFKCPACLRGSRMGRGEATVQHPPHPDPCSPKVEQRLRQQSFTVEGAPECFPPREPRHHAG